jgi:hypothetical protein
MVRLAVLCSRRGECHAVGTCRLRGLAFLRRQIETPVQIANPTRQASTIAQNDVFGRWTGMLFRAARSLGICLRINCRRYLI